MRHFLLCFALLLSSFSRCVGREKKDDVKWRSTIGTIEPRGNITWIHYKVNDVAHTARFYYQKYGQVHGEKFAMKYNVQDPAQIEIEYWNPVFEKSEKTYSFNGAVKRIRKKSLFQKMPCIDFTYEVNGSKIVKEQTLPVDYEKIYPSLDKTKKYVVQVCGEDTRRSIIHLEQPVINP
jgi:hypothetical protein